jgi:hypothetical protein
MADRSDNLGLLHGKNAASLAFVKVDIGETINRVSLVMMKTDGKIYRSAPTAGAKHVGILQTAGVTTASKEAIVENDPAQLFKAAVVTTDALAIAARAVRIKGSGGSDALVQTDLGEDVFAEDDLTLVLGAAASEFAVRVGRIALLDISGQFAYIKQYPFIDLTRQTETLQLTQDTAASDSLTMGRVPFAGEAVGKIESPLASAAGESYAVQFQKNSVNLGSAVTLTASASAFTEFSGNLGTVAEGDIIEADITLAGGSTLARMSLAVVITEY